METRRPEVPTNTWQADDDAVTKRCIQSIGKPVNQRQTGPLDTDNWNMRRARCW